MQGHDLQPYSSVTTQSSGQSISLPVSQNNGTPSLHFTFRMWPLHSSGMEVCLKLDGTGNGDPNDPGACPSAKNGDGAPIELPEKGVIGKISGFRSFSITITFVLSPSLLDEPDQPPPLLPLPLASPEVDHFSNPDPPPLEPEPEL